MATTVLTCGSLRLSVPASARTPSVHLSQADGSVHVTFENFSGTVKFEALIHNLIAKASESSKPLSIPTTSSPDPSLSPTNGDLGCDQLQPSQAVDHESVKPLTTEFTSSQRNDFYLSQNFDSQVFDSQDLKASQPFSYGPASQPLPMESDCLPSQLLPSQPFGSQPLDSQTLSHIPSSGTQTQAGSGFPISSAEASDLKEKASTLIPVVKGSDDIRSYLTLKSQSIKETNPSATYANNQDAQPSQTALPACHTPEGQTPLTPGLNKSYIVPDSPSSSDDFGLDQDDDYSGDENDSWRPSQPSSAGDEATEKGRAKAALKRPVGGSSTVERTGSSNAKRVRFDDKVHYAPSEPTKEIEESKKKGTEQGLQCTSLSKRPSKPSPWQTVDLCEGSPIPGRRWGGTFTRMSDSSVILLGGESEMSGFYKEMMIYQPLKSRWYHASGDTPDIPGGGRAWHTATRVRDSILVFGGEKEVNGEREQTNEALMYDSTYYCWYPPSFGGTPPMARAGHCAEIIPGTMHYVVFGGIHGKKWLNDLHVLTHLDAWTKVRLPSKSARPAARSYATLTATCGFLVLFGGNNKTKCFNDVHLMAKDYSWTEPVIMGRTPKPRTGHSAIPSKDGKSIIVYGGWDDQGKQRLFFSDVWELKIKSQTECQWVCLYPGDNATKTPGPRAGAAFCSANNDKDEMLLFGGWYQVAYYNDVTRLILSSPKLETR